MQHGFSNTHYQKDARNSSKKRSFLGQLLLLTHFDGTRPVIASLRHSSQTCIGICLFRKQADVPSELHQRQSIPKGGHSTKSRRSACRLLRWSSKCKKKVCTQLISTLCPRHNMFMRYYLDELPCRHIHGKKEDIHSSKDHVGHECTIIYFVAFICEKTLYANASAQRVFSMERTGSASTRCCLMLAISA